MSINFVECCNIKQKCRVFDIPPKNKLRRVFCFLDKCDVCGQTKAVIKNIEYDGTVKEVVTRSGDKAIKLYNKFSKLQNFEYKVEKGSKTNIWWFYFDGLDSFIKNFNGKKILKIE